MIIHQALHGYNQGHNRLGCSIGLSSFDDDSMKMLSDWSEYTGGSDNSYITAYPLRDSNYYVVAKTWYAKEMQRPGCVWTHSLILDINSIPEEFDFRDLNNFFRKPEGSDYSYYNNPIEYHHQSRMVTKFSLSVLLWLYYSLVGNCKQSLLKVDQSNIYYQELCLLLLQYLPLEMLCKVALCSGTAFARRFREDLINVQFTTSTNESLSKVIESNQDVLASICDGIVYICKSMLDENSDTDKTMRIFAPDIKADTTKLCAYGVLMNVLDETLSNNRSNYGFSNIVRVLATAFPTKMEGRLLKKTFCQERISSLFDKESATLSTLTINIDSEVFNYDDIDYDQRLQILYSNNKEEFFRYIKNIVDSEAPNIKGIEELNTWSKRLNAVDLAQLLCFDWNTFRSLVQLNRSILINSFWVNLPEEQFLPLYDEFRKKPFLEFDSWELLFTRVLCNGNQIDRSIFQLFVKNVATLVYDVMDYLETSIEYHVNPLLLNHCRMNSIAVLNWMSKRTEIGHCTQRFIMECIRPDDSYIKNIPVECWESIYSQDKDKSLTYFTYIFKLGYNWKNDFGLRCIKKGFYPLHIALSKSLLSEELWKQIEPCTASLSFLKEWDKCKKLRKGVSCYLKNNGYSIKVLNDFTPDNDINKQMMKYWD